MTLRQAWGKSVCSTPLLASLPSFQPTRSPFYSVFLNKCLQPRLNVYFLSTACLRRRKPRSSSRVLYYKKKKFFLIPIIVVGSFLVSSGRTQLRLVGEEKKKQHLLAHASAESRNHRQS